MQEENFFSGYAELTCALKARLMEDGEEALQREPVGLNLHLLLINLMNVICASNPGFFVPPFVPAMPELSVPVCRGAQWTGPRWLPSEYLYLPLPLLTSLTHKEEIIF